FPSRRQHTRWPRNWSSDVCSSDLGGWQFTELKKQPEDPKPELESVELIVEPGDKEEAEAGRRIGDAIAAGYLFTRNLQMQPGNEIGRASCRGRGRTMVGDGGGCVA